MKIMKSAASGATEHILPPGPGDVAMEDVYDAAEAKMEQAIATIAQEQNVTSLGPMYYRLPRNEQVTQLYSNTGYFANISIALKLGLIMLCIAISGISTTSIFYINKMRLQRIEGNIANEPTEIASLLAEMNQT